MEAARVCAERILREGGPTVASRLRFAYGRALQRAPSAAEEQVLAALLEKDRAALGMDPGRASRIAAAGQAPVPSDLPAVYLAAWTQVARAILNLPELVTRS